MNEMNLIKTIQVITSVCVLIIFLAIFIDFLLLSGQKGVKKEKKSIVETGTMTIFFVGYYFLLMPRWATFPVVSIFIKHSLMITGTAMIVLGCIINVLGRVYLGNNWANHIKIYDQHRLIIRGPYRLVRHPLYASIMLMFYGGVLLFRNYVDFITVSLIFIPFMYYRAKQEEKLLLLTFDEYASYQKKVGMFFPKFKS